MSITKEQQQALDDALVPREQRLRIAFLISASVPAIYMHEFWATTTFQKHCIKFKLNTKRYSFDLETFRDMLQICLKIPGQKFVDPPFEEEILTFMRELGYSENIKSLPDVKVEMLPQPWRTFETIINKCLSGKVTGRDLLRLSRAQILWGMFHQKNVDYVYLLWEDLVFQIKNKVSKRNKDMYYPRFTKVIINHFMSQDQSIPRRNKVDWHMAKDDPVLTIMRFIPQHEVVQKYGVILPGYLTNQAIKESEAYKTYYDLATEKVAPKPKYVRRSTRIKTDQAPQDAPGKRLKATAKVAKSRKKRQPAQGLETLSELALSEAEQMKIAIERSKTQFHSSHASCSGADEGTVSISKDNDDDADDQDDDVQEYDGQDDEGQDDVNEETASDNDGDDFVHPKFSTHDQEERHDEEDKQEEGSDLRVQTPSHYESTDDEESDEETQGANVRGEEIDKEETNEEEEVNELYRDMNINLAGKDTEMIDALQTNFNSRVLTRIISSILTCSTLSRIGIDSILNLNTESTTLVDVPVTSIAKMPLSSATTPPSPSIPPIQPLQQTPVPTPTIVPSTFLQDLLNFGLLFKFDDRVKALEDDFSEFKQTNQFAVVVSLIPGIINTYLANKMNESIKTAVQLQSDRLRDEAQAKNADFINKHDDNIKKIIKEQLVNDQLEAEVLTRSSNEAKTSHAIAANLSKLELKKILIDKMENNKSIHRSVQQEALYKALVDAYETDKDILETYRDTVTFKKMRMHEDEVEEPSAGSNRGSKRRRVGKEPKSTSSAQAEEPIHADEDLEEPAHQEFDTGFTEDQPVDETTQHHDWF
ncbi:hypothetical protein Tco_0084277 [Tanacetum coccineum]